MDSNPNQVVNTVMTEILFSKDIDPSNQANYQAFVAAWEKFVAEDTVGDHKKLLGGLAAQLGSL